MKLKSQFLNNTTTKPLNQNKMKQTAVNWLIDEAMKLVVQYMQGTLNEDTLDEVIYELGTKAKQLEKEQMHKCASFWRGKENEIEKPIFEQYYNTNFKSE